MNDPRGKSKSRLRHDKRTIPVKGYGEDDGKYYRCWNCGFICNADRDELGGEESRSGVAITQTHIEQGPAQPGAAYIGMTGDAARDARAVLAVLAGSVGHSHIAMEEGMDGAAKGVEHIHSAEVATGCPLCGTRNWK